MEHVGRVGVKVGGRMAGPGRGGEQGRGYGGVWTVFSRICRRGKGGVDGGAFAGRAGTGGKGGVESRRSRRQEAHGTASTTRMWVQTREGVTEWVEEKGFNLIYGPWPTLARPPEHPQFTCQLRRLIRPSVVYQRMSGKLSSLVVPTEQLDAANSLSRPMRPHC